MFRFFSIAVMWLFASAGLVSAQMITAVAISPDGASLLVAGDNRVLYSVDPQTLKVTERRYIPGQVEWLDFSTDGRTLYMRMDDGGFEMRSAGSFKERMAMEDIDVVAHSPGAERLLLMENNYDGGVLHVVNARNGKLLNRIELPDIDTNLVSISDDGASAIILTDAARSDDEPKEDPPSDLKDHAKYLFRQQNDGYTSSVLSVDLAAGTHRASPTFYRVSFPSQVRMVGDQMLVVKGRQDSALVARNGDTTLIDMGSDYVSVARLSDDGATMLLSNGSKVRFNQLSGGMVAADGQLLEADRITGPSERVTAADEAADGTIYLGTSAYRLWKITPGAAEIEARPVF